MLSRVSLICRETRQTTARVRTWSRGAVDPGTYSSEHVTELHCPRGYTPCRGLGNGLSSDPVRCCLWRSPGFFTEVCAASTRDTLLDSYFCDVYYPTGAAAANLPPCEKVEGNVGTLASRNACT